MRGLIHTRSCVPLRQWSIRRKTVQPSNTSFDLLLLVAQFSCHHHWDHVAWNLFLATLCFTHFVPSTLISVFTVTAQKLTKFELLCTALMRPESKKSGPKAPLNVGGNPLLDTFSTAPNSRATQRQTFSPTSQQCQLEG